MRRKDGKKKLKSLRSKPEYEYGLRDNQLHRDGALRITDKSNAYTTVSLFTGCGGLDLGFQGDFEVYGKKYDRNPFRTLSAYDNLDDAVSTYRLNLGNEIESRDLSEASEDQMPSADVLLGGFPCQDFSSSGPKVGVDGERGKLYMSLCRYMRHHRPKIVVGENVPHLGRLDGGRHLSQILSDFEDCGYRFRVWELYCPEYGLPQSRRRLFLVGIRDDLEGFPKKPKPTHLAQFFSIDQALKDLEAIDNEAVTNQSQYFVASKATAGGGQGDHTNRRGEVAYCIRANARGRIQFHYDLDRRLTVRECARLQSFPDDFVFPFTTQRNLTLIGNAVPPIVAHQVANSIGDYLESTNEGALKDDTASDFCDFQDRQLSMAV